MSGTRWKTNFKVGLFIFELSQKFAHKENLNRAYLAQLKSFVPKIETFFKISLLF